MGADAWLMANAGALVKEHRGQIVSASREEIQRVPSGFLFPLFGPLQGSLCGFYAYSSRAAFRP